MGGTTTPEYYQSENCALWYTTAAVVRTQQRSPGREYDCVYMYVHEFGGVCVQPGIETGCSTVMGVQQPVEDPVDRGDASEDMNVLLFEV